MRRSIQMNSLSGIVLTKLDVLDELATIRLCTAYRCNNEILREPPFDQQRLAECEPIYEDMPGWQASTFGITEYKKMPLAAKNYIKKIEVLTEVPIVMISTGPERHQTIELEDPCC